MKTIWSGFSVLLGSVSLLFFLGLGTFVGMSYLMKFDMLDRFITAWRSLDEPPASPAPAPEPPPKPKPETQIIDIPVTYPGKEKKDGVINFEIASRKLFSLGERTVGRETEKESVRAYYEFTEVDGNLLVLPPMLEGSERGRKEACTRALDLQPSIAESHNAKVKPGNCR